MLLSEMSLILLLTLNQFISIPPTLLAILVIVLSEVADYLVVTYLTILINITIVRLILIIPGPFQMFILHPTSLAFPFFDLSAGHTLGGLLAASLDDGSSASALKVTLKNFFGYTLDRREALRYLSSLPHALMSPVLMKACYGDILIYRSQSNVYLQTVWAALKMAVGETLTQEQVNVLLPGIPPAVFSVAQDDVCPAITRRLSIILFTGVGMIAMIILACLSLRGLIKKVLDNINASTQGSAALDPLPSSAFPNPPLEDEQLPSLPGSPASGRDVVAVSSTESDPVSDDEAFVYPDHSKGSTSSTPTNALAASLKEDECHRSPVASGSGIVTANSPGSDTESDDNEEFIYPGYNQSNESTSTFEGSQSSTTVEGSSTAIQCEARTDEAGISQAGLLVEGTIAQSGSHSPSSVSELGSARSEPTLKGLPTRDAKVGSAGIGSGLTVGEPGPSHVIQTARTLVDVERRAAQTPPLYPTHQSFPTSAFDFDLSIPRYHTFPTSAFNFEVPRQSGYPYSLAQAPSQNQLQPTSRFNGRNRRHTREAPDYTDLTPDHLCVPGSAPAAGSSSLNDTIDDNLGSGLDPTTPVQASPNDDKVHSTLDVTIADDLESTLDHPTTLQASPPAAPGTLAPELNAEDDERFDIERMTREWLMAQPKFKREIYYSKRGNTPKKQ